MHEIVRVALHNVEMNQNTIMICVRKYVHATHLNWGDLFPWSVMTAAMSIVGRTDYLALDKNGFPGRTPFLRSNEVGSGVEVVLRYEVWARSDHS